MIVWLFTSNWKESNTSRVHVCVCVCVWECVQTVHGNADKCLVPIRFIKRTSSDWLIFCAAFFFIFLYYYLDGSSFKVQHVYSFVLLTLRLLSPLNHHRFVGCHRILPSTFIQLHFEMSCYLVLQCDCKSSVYCVDERIKNCRALSNEKWFDCGKMCEKLIKKCALAGCQAKALSVSEPRMNEQMNKWMSKRASDSWILQSSRGLFRQQYSPCSTIFIVVNRRANIYYNNNVWWRTLRFWSILILIAHNLLSANFAFSVSLSFRFFFRLAWLPMECVCVPFCPCASFNSIRWSLMLMVLVFLFSFNCLVDGVVVVAYSFGWRYELYVDLKCKSPYIPYAW